MPLISISFRQWVQIGDGCQTITFSPDILNVLLHKMNLVLASLYLIPTLLHTILNVLTKICKI